MVDAAYRPMLMFETPVMVVTFVMMGRFLENSAKVKSKWVFYVTFSEAIVFLF